MDESRLEGRAPASAPPPQGASFPSFARAPLPIFRLALLVAAIFAFGAAGSIASTLRARLPAGAAAVAAHAAPAGASSIR